ncbi:NUDIX hydrolase [Chitinophaga nivalis]|uniref:NUDIX domain-containing protein n=1 Tax=Chitinophaga nivalis TaxID=2991709 RepID=A0ABT3IH12_9BACT|nr:NUDIX domain-containing protein [Chitinophaga nivalis]MCW3467072.1 NUDIX domain-containing protein [Chitinophaga nivalis]MCW3483237.1 NUDIX domain-containing protein [Chitinophaga nivalis]
MNYIDCVGLIVVENRKLLLAFSKNKKAWYLPGGKVDAGESGVSALQREIKEELNMELAAEELQWYYYITAPAFGEQQLLMKQHCYRYELRQVPQPTSEIEAIHYFSLAEYRKETHQVPGVLLAFAKLQEDGLVDGDPAGV